MPASLADPCKCEAHCCMLPPGFWAQRPVTHAAKHHRGLGSSPGICGTEVPACMLQVVAAAGGVEHADLVSLAEKCFAHLPTSSVTAKQLVAEVGAGGSQRSPPACASRVRMHVRSSTLAQQGWPAWSAWVGSGLARRMLPSPRMHSHAGAVSARPAILSRAVQSWLRQ